MAKKKSASTPSVGRISGADEKKKALEVAMAHLEKDFGSGTVMRLGDDAVQDVETISTGSIGLDFALGVGGLPRGRVTEIYGPESSGKTTLAIHVIAEAQKMRFEPGNAPEDAAHDARQFAQPISEPCPEGLRETTFYIM